MPELVDGLDSKSSALGHVGSSPTAPTALMGTYQRFPVSFVEGKGCWLTDQKGERYLDAVAGIATCSLGHSDQALKKALSTQLGKIQHVSNLYEIGEQEELAQWLVQNSCASNVFFCNSGAEANEGAIKLARKYGRIRKGIQNPIILCAKNSFHGRTLAAISATGQPKYQEGFEPLLVGFNFFEFNDLNSFNNTFNQLKDKKNNVVAIFIEPLQGEGGIKPGEAHFFQYLRKLCNQMNILLILDEVQTGMGRTGKLWGYQQLGIEPDIFTLAKGLGGGHAIGALLSNDKGNIFKPGDHASTFGGNPFACTAGLTVAKEIDRRNLTENAMQRGKELQKGLQSLIDIFPDQLEQTRGWGLIQGLVFKEVSTITPGEVVNAALEEKLLLISAGKDVIRIVPPLIINKIEINEIISRLKATLKKLI